MLPAVGGSSDDTVLAEMYESCLRKLVATGVVSVDRGDRGVMDISKF